MLRVLLSVSFLLFASLISQAKAGDPTGACCLDSSGERGGSGCLLLTHERCDAIGGAYQGDGTDCETSECAAGLGACCFSNGACELTSGSDCAESNGVFQGSGTVCDPNPCPPPSGACCLRLGAACRWLTESDCQRFRGSFLGPGTFCQPAPCAKPTDRPRRGAAPNPSWGAIKSRFR